MSTVAFLQCKDTVTALHITHQTMTPLIKTVLGIQSRSGLTPGESPGLEQVAQLPGISPESSLPTCVILVRSVQCPIWTYSTKNVQVVLEHC